MYKLYIIKGKNSVYYENEYKKDNKIISELLSINVQKGDFEIQYHSSNKHKIPNNVYSEMIKMLIDYYHIQGLLINDYINNELPRNVLYRINSNTLEVVFINNNNKDYIDYDFCMIRDNSNLSSFYYWKQQLKKDDVRIGRRKLYETKKGLYFLESGHREYLKDFIKK